MEQPAPAGAPHSEVEPAPRVTSEFICSGCGGPLDVVLVSDICLMAAWRLCPNCERDAELGREEAKAPVTGEGTNTNGRRESPG